MTTLILRDETKPNERRTLSKNQPHRELTMRRVHWLGCGLSSSVGVRRLISRNVPLTLWNRNLEKAYNMVQGLPNSHVCIERFDLDRLQSLINADDAVVSMLPASILGAGLYELERWCCLNSGWRELGLSSH